MEDEEIENEKAEYKEIEDEEMEESGSGSHYNAVTASTPKRLQPLRPGYFILGDKTLGYVPTMRRNRIIGEVDYWGGRFILEDEGPSGIEYATDNEVGSDVA